MYPTTKRRGECRRRAALAALLLGVGAASAQVLYHVDFESRAEGDYDIAAIKQDWGPNLVGDSTFVVPGHARIKSDPDLKRKVLEVKYSKGCVGFPDCTLRILPRFEAHDTAWIRFKMKFEPGFDFSRGGKIPGLCGGTCNAQCMSVSGKDGFSVREMWRENGKTIQYTYHADKREACGDGDDWSTPNFVPGKWYEILNQVILNTPGQNGGKGKQDGIVRSWLDGKPSYERKDFRFRDIASLKIDQLFFITFYGGKSADWAPARDTYASFSEFTVTTVDPRSLPTAAFRSRPAALPAKFAAVYSPAGLRVVNPFASPLRVRVRDVTGAAVAGFQAGEGTRVLPLRLRPGLYFVEWSGRGISGSLALPAL